MINLCKTLYSSQHPGNGPDLTATISISGEYSKVMSPTLMTGNLREDGTGKIFNTILFSVAAALHSLLDKNT